MPTASSRMRRAMVFTLCPRSRLSRASRRLSSSETPRMVSCFAMHHNYACMTLWPTPLLRRDEALDDFGNQLRGRRQVLEIDSVERVGGPVNVRRRVFVSVLFGDANGWKAEPA